MPSAKVLEQKQAIVAELTERLKNSVTGVLVNYKGINVADDTALRKELREAGVQYSVVKNTLLSRACEEAELTGLQTTLAGTTALATCDEDYAAAARILANYAKKSKTFEIKGGYLDGEVVELAEFNVSSLLRQLVYDRSLHSARSAPVCIEVYENRAFCFHYFLFIIIFI